MVRPPRSVAVAALLLTTGLPLAASAQDLQYRAVVAAGLQATDNLQFAPMNGPDGVEKPKPGFIGELGPSFIVSYETPRWLHELQYTLNFATVLGEGQQYNYTNRVEARSRYDVSEVTVANFALRATEGGFAFFPDPQPGQPVNAIVPGQFTFVNAEIAETVNRRLTEDVTFNEQVTGTAFFPVDANPPRSIVLGANLQLGLQYNDAPDTFAANFTSQVAVSTDQPCTEDGQCGQGRVCAVALNKCVIPDTTAAPLRAIIENQVNAPQLASRLGGNYRHDFENGFFSELDVGVQQVMRLTDGGGQNWGPAGRAALRYEREEAAVTLSFNHGTQLNIDLGGLVLADNVDLNTTIPLDRETRNLVLTLQGGFQRGTQYATDGSLDPGFSLFAGDAGLTYRPERWLPNFQVTLRYQFRYQISEPVPGAAVKPIELHAMRNAVALNFGFEFPERKGAGGQ